MEINVNKELKLVELWLANEEQNNSQIGEIVNNIIQKYKKDKYKTAVFHSGKNSLLPCTENLLRSNVH